MIKNKYQANISQKKDYKVTLIFDKYTSIPKPLYHY